MNRKIVKTMVWGNFVLVAVLSAGWQIQAQDAKAEDKTYPGFAPVDYYTMSKQQFFSRRVGNADPHLMSWFSQPDHMDWGADSPASPVDVHPYSPQPITEFCVPVSMWSGTTAPKDAHQ